MYSTYIDYYFCDLLKNLYPETDLEIEKDRRIAKNKKIYSEQFPLKIPRNLLLLY